MITYTNIVLQNDMKEIYLTNTTYSKDTGHRKALCQEKKEQPGVESNSCMKLEYTGSPTLTHRIYSLSKWSR